MLKKFQLFILVIVVGFCAFYPFIQEQNKGTGNAAIGDENGDSYKKNKSIHITETLYRSETLPDFSIYHDVKQKKHAFFGYLAPLVRQINSDMAQYRAFVLSFEAPPTSDVEKSELLKVADKFHIDSTLDFAAMKQEMLLRIDELPVELVLMQAANESAWGTSRFALQANNLFGQWCFKKGCGVIPQGRPEGETYEVRKFSHPIHSIKSYFNNLNTGHAYQSLRDIRLELRQQNKALDANKVAEGLLAYSTRREAYIKEIQAMIRINKKYIPQVNPSTQDNEQ